MVKKMVLAVVVLAGFAATPRPAMAMAASCTTDLADCYLAAANVDSFWYRWASGLDCELNYTDCVRRQLIGR